MKLIIDGSVEKTATNGQLGKTIEFLTPNGVKRKWVPVSSSGRTWYDDKVGDVLEQRLTTVKLTKPKSLVGSDGKPLLGADKKPIVITQQELMYDVDEGIESAALRAKVDMVVELKPTVVAVDKDAIPSTEKEPQLDEE